MDVLIYLIVLPVVALLVSLSLTPVVIRLSARYGAFDAPDERKLHSRKISRFGGIAAFSAFTLSYVILAVLVITERISVDISPSELLAFYLGTTLFFLLGLIDDILELGPKFKFISMVAIAVLVSFLGIRIGTLFGTYYLPEWASIALTVFWIVGIVNTINLIDGLDGLATGVGLVASVSFMIIAITRSDWASVLLISCVVGALAGFLPHNFFPAKIFLGDSGSLTIGFWLAAISAMGLYKQMTLVTLAVPLMILALPIADTTFAIIRRLFRRIPITSPDRRHIHHRLLFLFSRNAPEGDRLMESPAHRSAVIACYVISIAFASVAVYISIG